jgi:hypothetical protein
MHFTSTLRKIFLTITVIAMMSIIVIPAFADPIIPPVPPIEPPSGAPADPPASLFDFFHF